MKNRAYLLFFAIFSMIVSFAQSNRIASLNQPKPEKIISWQKLVTDEVPGLGKQSFLTFQNAQYDLINHFFPIYSERVALPYYTVSADSKIYNEIYQLLSDSEKTVVTSYDSQKKNFISDGINPVVTISLYRKKPYAYIQFIPIRKNKTTGNFEKLVSFSLQVIPDNSPNTIINSSSQKTYASNSVLANGKWYKVALSADGIYKMDYSFLKNLGLDANSINPQNIRIYGNGGGQLPFANSGFRYDDLQENAIYVSGQGDSKFDSTDYILFYGQSQHRWKYNSTDNKFHHNLNVYSDTTYYFITADSGIGKRITTQNSLTTPPTDTVTSFDDYQFHELETNNLLKSGRQWFGETFDILTSFNFTFSFANIETSSKAYVKVECAARRDSPGTDFLWSTANASSSFNVMGVATSNITSTYYKTNSDTLNFYPSLSGTIPVTVSKTTPSPAIGWLNYIEVNVRRQLTMNGSQMIFRDVNSSDTGNVSQFIVSNASSALQIWEVTDPINTKLQQINFSGNSLDFTLATDTLREFIAFNGQSFLIPKPHGEVLNQDLHAMGQSDLIIVTNPLFIDQANALANLHRTQDSMTVSVATTEQTYNEFSSGTQDVCAIRDFVKMFYDRAADSTQLPKYLLLFGRGSYNLKTTINNTNYVPAYESLLSNDPTASYTSDDFYGMLDNNEGNWDSPTEPDMLDIGVGRLPVKSVSEAELVVNKIIKYTSVPGSIETGNSCSTDVCYGLGDWINVITFCADDEDNSDHLKQADQIAEKIRNTHKNYNIDKIYLDAYQQVSTPGGERYPDATAALNRRMERGCLIVNYTGHGGELGWAHERFLEVYHINSWTNQCKLPLFFTATCEFSRWDNPELISAGELTLLNPIGGSIGLMSTTRVVYSGPNFTLNDNFYNYTFNPLPNGEMPHLGDLHLLTKNSMPPTAINQRNFSLLADPALSLNYPDYSVATTDINDSLVNVLKLDTARALSKVSVKGEVRDMNGNLLTNFNGIIYPTVFDKARKITTLSNDPTSPPKTFYLQKNILFKGKASVTNGKFSFSFIVPKDIAYNFDKGRISYYSHNGYQDASGYFEDFIIGGTDSTAPQDYAGPDIKLYMNNEKFAYGGITDANPKIYALVSDSNGINTAGISIGHDITAVLDGNTVQPIVLNDYYESELNNYKKGTVRYPLKDLAEGNHNLTVKVWDVYNNSSSTSTEFVVASSAELALKHVLNYPNPFTTKTSFYFEHNKCCTNMDVQIQIFTVSGKLIKSIYQLINMDGYRSSPIEWDGTDDYGDKIGRGVYVYRLRVKASGETAEQFEKLVILK
ncbi:MAG: type IX secretion system sortase PorU [Bacteroidetes bacterium]|nr:type IX secretion system sortase PorU [Bacteroidota bacterium]